MGYTDLSDRAKNTYELLILRNKFTKSSIFAKELDEWEDSLQFRIDYTDIKNVCSIIDWYKYYLDNY